MKLAVLLSLTFCGCAHKQRIAVVPGVHKYSNCREVSINAKTAEVTVICPMEVKP